MKIEADRTVCAAAGQCVLSAPHVFGQDDTEGVVLVLDASPPEEEREAVLEAVKRCPTQAIHLIED